MADDEQRTRHDRPPLVEVARILDGMVSAALGWLELAETGSPAAGDIQQVSRVCSPSRHPSGSSYADC